MDEKKKRKKGNIPAAEADLIVLSRNIVEAWKKQPVFTLVWTNPQAFETAVNLLETSFSERESTKGERSIVTVDLKSINTEINQNLSYVKNYLADQFTKKTAPAHYPDFGIVKTSRGYGLPEDNDKRFYALKQLITSIGASQFSGQRYGHAYWLDILTRFETAKNKASESDSATSQYVNVKTEQKAVIRQTLNALILVIKANHPHQWRDELRVWGFQKEKY
ncbi:MAG: hypothetical protein LBN71_03925 [Tannerella sp.]|jgi:hypothetical protein|nr:hypothetical protein [Tannerella sp.]